MFIPLRLSLQPGTTLDFKFPRNVNIERAILGCYAPLIGIYRRLYSLLFRSSSAHEVETVGCPETSRTNFQSREGNIPDERTPQPDANSLEESILW